MTIINDAHGRAQKITGQILDLVEELAVMQGKQHISDDTEGSSSMEEDFLEDAMDRGIDDADARKLYKALDAICNGVGEG